jgi:hypothetical protein
MKKLIFVMLIVLNGLNVYAQTNTYKRTGKIIYSDDSFEKNREVSRAFNNLYIAIKQIGWSNNGLFAYLRNETNYMWLVGVNLVIFDTVEDRVLEEIIIGCDDDGNASEENIRSGLRNWNNILEKYRINGRINQFETRFYITPDKFPYYSQTGISYDCWFEATIEDHDNHEYYEYNEYEVEWKLIVSNGPRKKSIASSTEKPKGFIGMGGGYVGSEIIGYLKNPYEDRILVIIRHYYAGFEGEIDSEIEYHGCHLNVGFN